MPFLIIVPHQSPTNTSRQEQAQLRFQCSKAFPNAPPTAKHFPRFSQRFRPFFQGFRFSMVLPDSSMVLFNLSAVLIHFSMVLFNFAPVCSILQLCYRSVFNAYPNAPTTILTIAPYKRFCSFLPWFYFRASTP